MHNLFIVLLLATAASKKPSIAMTAVTPALTQQRDAIAAELSPSAKRKLHDVGVSLLASPAGITEGTSRAAIASAFPGVNFSADDISALQLVVLMDVPQSAEQDLKSLME